MKKTLLISSLFALASTQTVAADLIQAHGMNFGMGQVKVNGLKSYTPTVEYNVTLLGGIHVAAGFAPSRSNLQQDYQGISPFNATGPKILEQSTKIKSNWNAHVGYNFYFDGFDLTPYVGVSQFDAEYESIDFVNNTKTNAKGSESVMYYGVQAKLDDHPITFGVRTFESSDIKHLDVDRSVMFTLGAQF